LSNYNGTSDEARNAVIIISGNQNASYVVNCPAVQKLYIITNSLSASATAYFGPTGGSTLTIPNGYTVLAYCTGTTMVALAGLVGNQTINGNLSVSGTATITGAISSSGAITGTGFNGAGTGLTGTAASLTVANIASGAANQILYQSASSTTAFIASPSVAGTAILFNGTGFVWSTVAAAVASGAVYENTQTITTNYTMKTGYNGESVGPITIASGITVTIPSGSRWAII
jgi:hypothetical protein